MGHLNELHEKYEAEGLTVIAITTESKSTVDAFVEETGATHPIVIESSDSGSAYGISGYPSSFLIDGSGTVVWSGHPSGIKDETIQEVLAGLLPKLPKSLAAIQKAVTKDKLAEACKLIAKKQATEGLKDEETAALAQAAKWLDTQREGAKKRVERAMAKSDYYTAWVTWDKASDAWKGNDFGKEAAAEAKALLADKEAKLEIKAGQKLAKIKAKMSSLGAKKAIKQLEALQTKKYKGTFAGREAGKLIRKFREQLARR